MAGVAAHRAQREVHGLLHHRRRHAAARHDPVGVAVRVVAAGAVVVRRIERDDAVDVGRIPGDRVPVAERMRGRVVVTAQVELLGLRRGAGVRVEGAATGHVEGRVVQVEVVDRVPEDLLQVHAVVDVAAGLLDRDRVVVDGLEERRVELVRSAVAVEVVRVVVALHDRLAEHILGILLDVIPQLLGEVHDRGVVRAG